MLIEYSGEGAQCQAAKLLEVIVLQYRGQIDSVSSNILKSIQVTIKVFQRFLFVSLFS